MAHLRALEINVKRIFWSSIRWSDGPSKTRKPSNRGQQPRWETVHNTDRKKTSEATLERKFTVMYKITSVHIWRRRRRKKKIQKKTIQTAYASCYTERHSVWFVRDYCRRSLTHNCYKVERKGQLCPQLAILSCTLVTFRVLKKACANVLGRKKTNNKTFIIV